MSIFPILSYLFAKHNQFFADYPQTTSLDTRWRQKNLLESQPTSIAYSGFSSLSSELQNVTDMADTSVQFWGKIWRIYMRFWSWVKIYVNALFHWGNFTPETVIFAKILESYSIAPGVISTHAFVHLTLILWRCEIRHISSDLCVLGWNFELKILSVQKN